MKDGEIVKVLQSHCKAAKQIPFSNGKNKQKEKAGILVGENVEQYEEEVNIHNEKKVLQKVALHDKENANNYAVGWVIDSAMKICMVCFAPFSFFSRRHHCRVCGNLVCDKCSTLRIKIAALSEPNGSRYCQSCSKHNAKPQKKSVVADENADPKKLQVTESSVKKLNEDQSSALAEQSLNKQEDVPTKSHTASVAKNGAIDQEVAAKGYWENSNSPFSGSIATENTPISQIPSRNRSRSRSFSTSYSNESSKTSSRSSRRKKSRDEIDFSPENQERYPSHFETPRGYLDAYQKAITVGVWEAEGSTPGSLASASTATGTPIRSPTNQQGRFSHRSSTRSASFSGRSGSYGNNRSWDANSECQSTFSSPNPDTPQTFVSSQGGQGDDSDFSPLTDPFVSPDARDAAMAAKRSFSRHPPSKWNNREIEEEAQASISRPRSHSRSQSFSVNPIENRSRSRSQSFSGNFGSNNPEEDLESISSSFTSQPRGILKSSTSSTSLSSTSHNAPNSAIKTRKNDMNGYRDRDNLDQDYTFSKASTRKSMDSFVPTPAFVIKASLKSATNGDLVFINVLKHEMVEKFGQYADSSRTNYSLARFYASGIKNEDINGHIYSVVDVVLSQSIVDDCMSDRSARNEYCAGILRQLAILFNMKLIGDYKVVDVKKNYLGKWSFGEMDMDQRKISSQNNTTTAGMSSSISASTNNTATPNRRTNSRKNPMV